MKNEILEEVWRARDKIFAECDYDLKKLVTRMRSLEAKHPERLVSYASRTAKDIIHKPAAKAEKPARAKRNTLPA